MHLKKTMLVTLCCFIFMFGINNLQLSEEINQENLIRIHVIANSDDETDQKIKLQVKDAVVAFLKPKLAQSHSIAESRQIILSNLPQIEETAKTKLSDLQSASAITMQYGHFNFPVKYYGSFSLPAGNYEALRISIGKGQGHNWWCVLFPPLCFTDSNTATSGKYTNQSPQKELTIKWKSAELLKKWNGEINYEAKKEHTE